MSLTEALTIVRGAGYRVTKQKPKAAVVVPTLNAIGKPFSALYDPKYRVKYKTPRIGYQPSTAANPSEARRVYRGCIKQMYPDNETLVKKILERNGCAS